MERERETKKLRRVKKEINLVNKIYKMSISISLSMSITIVYNIKRVRVCVPMPINGWYPQIGLITSRYLV